MTMSAKLCLLVFAIFGSVQVQINGAPSSTEVIAKLAPDLKQLAEELAAKLDALSQKIDSKILETDTELVSEISKLEEEWEKKIDSFAEKHDECSSEINRLVELSSEISSSTAQCASDLRQKLLDVQQSSTLQSKSLKEAANKLAEISVSCVWVSGQLPKCDVSTNPMSAFANLLGEGGETLGTGLALAEAYGSQILSCWRNSSDKTASPAQEIIQDIAQCAKAQS